MYLILFHLFCFKFLNGMLSSRLLYKKRMNIYKTNRHDIKNL